MTIDLVWAFQNRAYMYLGGQVIMIVYLPPRPGGQVIMIVYLPPRPQPDNKQPDVR